MNHYNSHQHGLVTPLGEIPSRGSLGRRIIFTFGVGFFLLISAFATYLVLTERENLRRDSVNETTSMAQALASSSLPWVLADDVAGLQESVRAFHGYPGFSYALVISPTGRVLAHSDPSKVGMYLTDEASQSLLKSPPAPRIMEDTPELIAAAAPIRVNGRQVGWAKVASLKRENAGYLQDMIRNSIIFLLAATALSFLAATLIANRLGRHINALVRVAEAVQAGNYSTRVSVPAGEDEIARLGNSLNGMLEALARNERDLRAASIYTRSLIEASLDPLVTISPEGKITDVNEATEKATGMNRSELIGTDFADYFTEPDRARAGYQQVFAQGSVTDYPLALRHRDGHITDVLYNASIYRAGTGKVLGMFAAARDITARKKAEDILRQSEAALKDAQRIAHVGSWHLDLATNQVYWSEELYKMYGYDPSLPPPLYTESAKLFTPESWDRLTSAIARAAETGTPYELELEMVNIRGRRGWMLAIGEQVRNEQGKPIRVRGVAMDITERKQAEEVLRSASLYSRSLIEASLDPFVTISAEGKITDVNEATVNATGAARGDLIGTDFADYFTEPDRARAGYRQVFENGFVTDYPLTIRRSDGRMMDVLYNASIYRDANGNVQGVFAAARDVTERNKAEAAVRKSEALLQATMKILPVGMWVLDANGQVIFGNDAAQKIWSGIRYVGGDQLGSYKGWRADTGKPVGPHEWAGARAVEKGEITSNEELEIECFDGTHKFILDSAVPLHNDDGTIRGAVTVNQDITERKQAENELREKKERLTLATLINGVGIWDWNLKTQQLIWDDSMYALYHIRREDFTGTEEAWRKSLHPDDLARADQEVADAIAGIRPFDTEFRVIWPDGEIRYIKAVAKVFRDEHGNPARMLGTNLDITSRKLAENKIRESEMKFRSMTDTSPLAIYMSSGIEQKAEYINPTFTRLFGYTLEEVPSAEQWWPLAYPDETYRKQIADEWQRKVEQAIKTNSQIEPMEVVVTCKDGSKKNIVWGYISTGVQNWAFGQDVTERKQAEEALRKSEERMRLEFSRMPIGYIIWDSQFRVEGWNPAAEKIFGYSLDEAKGRHPYEIIVPAQAQPQVDEVWHRLLAGDETAHSVNENITKDGRTIICEWTNTPLKDADGTIHGAMAMVQDITERQHAEEEVRRLNAELEQRVQQRTAQLEAANRELEAFSYSVSHDLRSPLRAIDGFSNILLQDYDRKLDAEGNRLIGVIRDNTLRMARLIDDILAFSRLGRKEMATQEVDMTRLANEAALELAPTWEGRNVRLEIGELPATHGDAAMLRQVWANLLGNAIKFTRKMAPARIDVSGRTEGGELVYCVRDNGAGFDMQYADKLFGVFQRLHSTEEFEGTGAGLAIVKRIVVRHGGRVWANGKVNEGAAFYFALPAKPDRDAEA